MRRLPQHASSLPGMMNRTCPWPRARYWRNATMEVPVLPYISFATSFRWAKRKRWMDTAWFKNLTKTCTATDQKSSWYPIHIMRVLQQIYRNARIFWKPVGWPPPFRSIVAAMSRTRQDEHPTPPLFSLSARPEDERIQRTRNRSNARHGHYLPHPNGVGLTYCYRP